MGVPMMLMLVLELVRFIYGVILGTPLGFVEGT
jgi:hypothetical protein